MVALVHEACDTANNGEVICDYDKIIAPCAIGEPTPEETPSPDPVSSPSPDPSSSPTPPPCPNPKPADCCECGPPPPGTVGLLGSWQCSATCPEWTPVGDGCYTTKELECPSSLYTYSFIYGGICCPATPTPTSTPTPNPTPPQTAEACEALGYFWDAIGGPGFGGQCVDEDACDNQGLFWTFLPGNTTQHTCRGLYVLDPETGCPNPEPTFECGDIIPETNCPYTYWTNNVCFSPIIIDTAGDGLKFSDAAHGVSFDLDGNPDGVKEHLSWPVGADDAWLALDRNRNGTIDSGRELFGNVTPQRAMPGRNGEPNGFKALAVFDLPDYNGNGDGVIDSHDGFWRYLRLWLDANRDGVSQAAELRTLEEYDIVRLHFDDKKSKKTDAYGNQFRYRAKVDDAKGAKVGRWAWDVFLIAGQ